jgi:hypothetical protein
MVFVQLVDKSVLLCRAQGVEFVQQWFKLIFGQVT